MESRVALGGIAVTPHSNALNSCRPTCGRRLYIQPNSLRHELCRNRIGDPARIPHRPHM